MRSSVGFSSRTLQLVCVQRAFVPVRVQYRHVEWRFGCIHLELSDGKWNNNENSDSRIKDWTEGSDKIYHNLGVFVLDRTHITSMYETPLWAHGVPSSMWGGSVFDLVIISQRTRWFILVRRNYETEHVKVVAPCTRRKCFSQMIRSLPIFWPLSFLSYFSLSKCHSGPAAP